MIINILETKTVPTIQVKFNEKDIIFHSKYNPMREAADWVNNVLAYANLNNDLIVIGLGAGYHIQELAAKVKCRKITVIEFNEEYYEWFIKSPFYKELIHLSNVELIDFGCLLGNKRINLFKDLHSNNILIQKKALEIFPEKYVKFKDILDDIQIQKMSFKNQSAKMEHNYYLNLSLKDTSIGVFENYYGKSMLLISAGPSLDKQLPLLKEISDLGTIVIGAVGTALKSLVKQDIIPDFFMITDPNEDTILQLVDIDLPNTPLFYLSTANHETILSHTGPRYIVFQDGYGRAMNDAKEKEEPLINTGGSVATTLLDLMVYLGGEKIGLVGQDLAFSDGFTHANNTPLKREVSNEDYLLKVQDYYQTKLIPTSRNLLAYKKWLERFAKNHPTIHLYNCTEGGAFLDNWNHLSLQDFLNLPSEHTMKG